MSGQQVRERIESLRVPLAELARRLEISPQALQKRLTVGDVKVGVLIELAAVLGKPIRFFLDSNNAVSTGQQDTQLIIGRAEASRATLTNQVTLIDRAIICQNKLREKEQTIADLRRIITLYEQLLNPNLID